MRRKVQCPNDTQCCAKRVCKLLDTPRNVSLIKCASRSLGTASRQCLRTASTGAVCVSFLVLTIYFALDLRIPDQLQGQRLEKRNTNAYPLVPLRQRNPVFRSPQLKRPCDTQPNSQILFAHYIPSLMSLTVWPRVAEHDVAPFPARA